jgi:hypothetical protein
MKINFQSYNPVIIQFPAFAGGKFISNCLALSNGAVPQDSKLVEYLLNYPDDYQYRFNMVINTLPSTQKNMLNWISNYELGDTQLFGPGHLEWKNGNINKQNINKITKKLSNSNLKFFIVSHSGPEEVRNILKIWPNATVLMLINYVKFGTIAHRLKHNIGKYNEQYTGNYCKSMYSQLAGPDWPLWEEFESCGFNIKKLNNCPEHIQTEMSQYYQWHTVPTDPFLIDIDRHIFNKLQFLKLIHRVYQALELKDFNANMVGKFWQQYMNLHIDNI